MKERADPSLLLDAMSHVWNEIYPVIIKIRDTSKLFGLYSHSPCPQYVFYRDREFFRFL